MSLPPPRRRHHTTSTTHSDSLSPVCSTSAAYSNALESALAHLQSLLTNPHSKSWKPVSVPATSSSPSPDPTLATAAASLSSTSTSTSTEPTASNGLEGKGTSDVGPSPGPFVNGLAPLDPSQVRVHRQFDSARNADMVRAVAEVACDPDAASPIDLDAVRAVLSTPEIRPQWDKLVDASTGLSLLDPLTRITKTDYRLGWPASPRDTITISRTFPSPPDGSAAAPSLIDLSTSLPRAADEPAFLRPAPPFVRAHTHLMAWCFQFLPPTAAAPHPPPATSSLLSPPPAPTLTAVPASDASAPPPAPPRLRITVFWQWSLRLAAPLSATASASTSSASSYASPHTAHVAPLIASLVSYLRMSTPGAGPLPLVRGYGDGVEMNRDEWDVQTETRAVDYAVVALPGAGVGTGTSPTSEDREKEKEEKEEEEEEEKEVEGSVGGNLQGLDELYRRRERRRLERSIEFSLPPLGVQFPPARPPEGAAAEIQTAAAGLETTSGDGWDVRITVKALGGGGGAGTTTAMTPVSTPGLVVRDTALSTTSTPTPASEIDTSYSVSLSATPARRRSGSPPPARLVLRVTHPALKVQSHLLRVTITVQRLAGGKRVRVNGEKIEVVERTATAATAVARRRRRGGVGDWLAVAAAGDGDGDGDGDGEANVAASIETETTSASDANRALVGSRQNSADSTGGSGSDETGTVGTTTTTSPPPPPPPSSASSSAQIASLLRRSYIYFLSLLQEPPAKWRHVTDSAGVSVTQLLSPDPTLTIYRAEAVFVGVGVWDAFATVVTPGVRKTWDKHVEGAVLIADEENGAGAGELSEVWWERRKGVWPVS